MTQQMVDAARRGEFDYYQRNRLIGSDRFIATPDAVIRAMLEAALASAPDHAAPVGQGAGPIPRIVTTRKPKPRR